MKELTLFHPLNGCSEIPSMLNCPFYYQPCEASLVAARQVQQAIAEMVEWGTEPLDGKMFGVLVVADGDSVGYLQAYSGQIGGRADWSGWVPAVFDYLQPDGYFVTHENEISLLNSRISEMEHSARFQIDCARLSAAEEDKERRIAEYRAFMAEQKALRRERRECGEAEDVLIRESQFQKAELKRLKKLLEEKNAPLKIAVDRHKQQVADLKRQRRMMSDDLQGWLFRQFVLLNGKGKSRNLFEIFGEAITRIPSGAGECCAPKMLQYAFSHGYVPLALAEFWYGKSPVGEVRHHLQFYPACQSKCKPILDFMLEGVDVEPNPLQEQEQETELDVVFDDQYIVVVNKPAGMLSVPGKGARWSALEILERQYTARGKSLRLFPVHRLDMQTSGVLVFAKSVDVQRCLQKEFASHRTKKTYVAVVEGSMTVGAEGVVDLPLSPDYVHRPMQMVDYVNGKAAVTRYEVLSSANGRTRLLLHPEHGRTHQLRVHCAHKDGLGCPIVGDDLYGSHDSRLLLHAMELRLTNAINECEYHLRIEAPF